MADDPICIHVNGEPLAVVPGLSVTELLDQLRLPEQGVAVAIDDEVIPRVRHRSTPLASGMRVEVIRAVGGG